MNLTPKAIGEEKLDNDYGLGFTLNYRILGLTFIPGQSMTPKTQRIDPLYLRWECGAISGISIQHSLSHCPSARIPLVFELDHSWNRNVLEQQLG